MGWVPDLPPSMARWRGFRDGGGFIPKSVAGHGLFLTTDDGFIRVDEDRMVGGAAALAGWGARAVTMLVQYSDGSAGGSLAQRTAVIAGDEGGIDSIVVNLNPANDQWRLVAPDAAIIAAVVIPEGDREALYDSAVFPFGCPARTDSAAAAANISGPVLVFCNADENEPVNPVYVTPNDVGVLEYDELQPDPAITPAPDFMATSVESFNGRMHFLGTMEGATSHPQRHRWSAVGTAYPNEAIVGSGWLDLAEFQRRGLRIESMQDKLVLYYEDGVAFQIPTGFYADAYRPQIVSRSRGLMGTHSMCAISPHLHFGIFNDGWWTLDSSGRWSKLGRIILQESEGKSHELAKWEDTFYADLDYDNKHRIVCAYDKFRQLVRIAYTASSGGDNTKILNYHWPTDSCWPDTYTKAVSMWGLYDVQSSPGTTWAGMGLILTWSAVLGSWGSFAPQFVDETIVHGSIEGLVYARDYDVITYDGAAPAYSYRTHEVNFNENPLLEQTFHRLGVEYMNTAGSAMTAIALVDNLGEFQSQSLPLTDGVAGTMQNAYGHFRLKGSNHGFWLVGAGPVLIRSIVPELMLYTSDDREGQV